MAIRVLIADDHGLERGAVRDALKTCVSIKVVAEASSGREALALASRSKPDVALLDMHMPGSLDGLTCVERIKKRLPETCVIVISAFNDEGSVKMAFRRGADAFISKAVDPADIASALRATAQRTVFHAPLDGLSCNGQLTEGLTERELSVLKAVAAGLPNKAISQQLWVTEHTVKFHLTNIFRKTATANRTEAARWAHQRGLVEEPSPSSADGSPNGTRSRLTAVPA
jgi:DNA-binding NarL/FixJ family response regulator